MANPTTLRNPYLCEAGSRKEMRPIATTHESLTGSCNLLLPHPIQCSTQLRFSPQSNSK